MALSEMTFKAYGPDEAIEEQHLIEKGQYHDEAAALEQRKRMNDARREAEANKVLAQRIQDYKYKKSLEKQGITKNTIRSVITGVQNLKENPKTPRESAKSFEPANTTTQITDAQLDAIVQRNRARKQAEIDAKEAEERRKSQVAEINEEIAGLANERIASLASEPSFSETRPTTPKSKDTTTTIALDDLFNQPRQNKSAPDKFWET